MRRPPAESLPTDQVDSIPAVRRATKPSEPPTGFRALVVGGLLMAACFVAGRIGIALAIPPEDSVVFWPAAGVALAGLMVYGHRFAPAVFAGCAVVVLDTAPQIDGATLAAAFAVGAATTVQAAAGAWFSERTVRRPYALQQAPDIVNLLFWGGIVACLAGSVIVPPLASITGMLPEASFSATWVLWCVANLLGVVAVAPVLLVALTTFSDTSGRGWGRAFAALATGLIFLSLVAAVVYTVERSVEQADRVEVARKANELKELLAQNFLGYRDVLVANDRLMTSSNNVTAEEFRRFNQEFFILHPGISALSLNPQIPSGDREAYVAFVQEQGFDQFDILQRTGPGELVSAKPRDVYYPIGYIEPYETNGGAQGLDTYAPDPVGGNLRVKAMDHGLESDHTTTTGRITLVQNENIYAMLVYHPVLDNERPGEATANDSPTVDRSNLLGYIAGVFAVPTVMRPVAERAAELNIDFAVNDLNASDPDKRFLYDSRTVDNTEPEASQLLDATVAETRRIEFFEHTLEFSFYKPQLDGASGVNWPLWSLSVASVLCAGAGIMLLLLLIGQTGMVQDLVGERTRELADANDELKEFAYRTSHDLRSPLVSSVQLLNHVEQNLTPGMSAETVTTTRTMVSMAGRSLRELETLVDDILNLTKLREELPNPGPVDVVAMVDETIEQLSHLDGFDRINFARELSATKHLVAHDAQVRLIVANLISNAIKYQDRDADHSEVTIRTSSTDDHYEIEVVDNGIGIPPERRDDLYTMFARFHARTSFGSGLGLYMVKKSVERLNGTIEYRTVDSKTSFLITVPLTPTTTA